MAQDSTEIAVGFSGFRTLFIPRLSVCISIAGSVLFLLHQPFVPYSGFYIASFLLALLLLNGTVSWVCYCSEPCWANLRENVLWRENQIRSFDKVSGDHLAWFKTTDIALAELDSSIAQKTAELVRQKETWLDDIHSRETAIRGQQPNVGHIVRAQSDDSYKEALQLLKLRLREIANEESRKVAKLTTEQSRFISDFEASALINQQSIQGVPVSVLESLAASHIISAADLSSERIKKLPGLSASARVALIAWRTKVQQEARTKLPSVKRSANEISNSERGAIERQIATLEAQIQQNVTSTAQRRRNSIRTQRDRINEMLKELKLERQSKLSRFDQALKELTDEHHKMKSELVQSCSGVLAQVESAAKQLRQSTQQLESYDVATFGNYLRALMFIQL